MTKFFRVPTKSCENILLDIIKGVCEDPWRNDTNSPKQWKHNITKFTFIHLENNTQTKTMLCLFQNKTCTINFLSKTKLLAHVPVRSLARVPGVAHLCSRKIWHACQGLPAGRVWHACQGLPTPALGKFLLLIFMTKVAKKTCQTSKEKAYLTFYAQRQSLAPRCWNRSSHSGKQLLARDWKYE